MRNYSFLPRAAVPQWPQHDTGPARHGTQVRVKITRSESEVKFPRPRVPSRRRRGPDRGGEFLCRPRVWGQKPHACRSSVSATAAHADQSSELGQIPSSRVPSAMAGHGRGGLAARLGPTLGSSSRCWAGAWRWRRLYLVTSPPCAKEASVPVSGLPFCAPLRSGRINGGWMRINY